MNRRFVVRPRPVTRKRGHRGAVLPDALSHPDNPPPSSSRPRIPNIASRNCHHCDFLMHFDMSSQDGCLHENCEVRGFISTHHLNLVCIAALRHILIIDIPAGKCLSLLYSSSTTRSVCHCLPPQHQRAQSIVGTHPHHPLCLQDRKPHSQPSSNNGK